MDHVAVTVPDMDRARRLFEGPLNMELRRTGTRRATGGDIAIVSDGSGMKVELVSESATGGDLLHLAFLVDDVDSVSEMLTASHDCSVLRPKLWLAAAKADFCTLRHDSGLEIQLVRYDDDSPDI